MSEQTTPTAGLHTRTDSVDDLSAEERFWLSGWMDDLPETDAQAAPGLDDAGLLNVWHRYHLIGDVLRERAAVPGATAPAFQSAETASRQARDIMARALAQPAPTPAVTEVHGTPSVGTPQAPVVVPVGAPIQAAANDAVFRWKAVAAVACVTSALSLMWGSSGWPSGEQPSAVLAKADSVPAVTLSTGSTVAASVQVQGAVPPLASPGLDPDAVWVSTPHGPVLRDARLEGMMQAHRQIGGATAFQSPAGFLRNATFDPAQR